MFEITELNKILDGSSSSTRHRRSLSESYMIARIIRSFDDFEYLLGKKMTSVKLQNAPKFENGDLKN